MGGMVFDRFPNCLVIGENAVKTTGTQLRKFGDIEKVAVITDRGLKTLPIVTAFMSHLDEQGFDAMLFSDVRPLPTDTNVVEASEKMKDFGAQAIVAIGGGSAMDCARAANALYSYGGTLDDHSIAKRKFDYSKATLKPCIAICTTSGTGSEVAAGCGIIKTDEATGEGIGFYIISAPALIPDVSIIDPLMSISLSPEITAATGMDALTHAYESLVSSSSFPIVSGLGLEAIRLVFLSLRAAVNDGNDMAARESMAIAATTAAMSFQLGGLGLVHAISEGLSAFALIPHGVANAILLPPVMRFNSPCSQDMLVRIAAAMGVNTFEIDAADAASRAIFEVESLLQDISIPATLAEYLTMRETSQPDTFCSIKREAVEMAANLAMETSFIKNNPRDAAKADIDSILDLQFRGYKFSLHH